MTPLVSILIPCHNASRWLAGTLESLLAQTWPRCEIIVVDDGSTDGSGEIAGRYTARGVRVATQPNRGPSAASNHALRLAQGDYIKFCDSDDLHSPDMVALQVAALTAQPGRLAYAEWARFYRDPSEADFQTRPGWHDATPVDWLVETWADAQPMMQCAQFLLPRAVLDRAGGWDERLTLINDFEFFTRLLLTSSGLVFTPGARLYYRSGLRGSVSGLRSFAAWRSAHLSTTLGIGYLLAAENSGRTRRAAAAMLQGLIYSMYPNCPELVADLAGRVRTLGGSALAPQGGRGFRLARRVIGWKAARWLQIWSGKYPRPAKA